MKILLVASGFTGATLPLGNHLAHIGCKVNFYNLAQWDLASIESVDFDIPRRIPKGKPEQLSKSNRLYSYLDESINFYILPYWKQKRRMEKFLIGKIFPLVNKILIKKYIKYIIAEKADFIDLIVHSERDLLIAESIKKSGIPFCITYHEVLQGLDNNRKLKTVVDKTLKYGTPVILHSHNTAEDLIQAAGDENIRKRIHIINFGAFESFLSYGEGLCPKGLPPKYLLYLGHIHPYKGLKFLYEAALLLDKNLGETKIVVAGGGYDPIINEMKKNERFVVYNHFIANAELVGLIRHCQAIICPYVAASQSGLVQTGMVFDKPIIATRVGAFTEVIHDGDNGILCEPANAQSLAEAMIKFIKITTPLNSTSMSKKLDWEIIANEYLQLFKFKDVKKGKM